MAINKDRERKINKTVVRSMLGLSHYYKFKQRLNYLGKKWKRNIIEVTEEYTSKTCGNCGHLNEKLGGNKKFHCGKCKKTFDRDINGARNILLKYLSDIHGERCVPRKVRIK